MSCCQRRCCAGTFCCIAIVISVVLGAIAGILYGFGLIPNITVAVWIAFGTGALSLVLLVLGIYWGAITAPNALSKCLCCNIACLLVGIIGTFVTSLAALSINLFPIFMSIAALVALGAAFLSILLISITAFLVCFIRKLCAYNNEIA